MPNKDPYSNTAQFGVVNTNATAPQVNSSVLGNLANTNIVGQVIVYNNPHHTVGTLVNGPGIPPGYDDSVHADLTGRSQHKSDRDHGTRDEHQQNPHYAFFGQLVFTATVLGQGQDPGTLILTDSDAAGTLQKLGPLGNIRVTGEGIDPSKPAITITGMHTDGTGLTTITLSSPLIADLVSTPGTYYAYTFGGPRLEVARDGGFEFHVVGNVTGHFLHGGQISPPQNAENTDDWTFFDSLTNPNQWFAGIAIAPTAIMPANNRSAPRASRWVSSRETATSRSP